MKGKLGPRDLNAKSLPELRRTLDNDFKKYIRHRDTDGHTGWGNCITCGKPILRGTQDCQAGHYIPVGRNCDSALAFTEENCNAQCAKCNMHEGGKFVAHGIAIAEKFGADVLERLQAMESDKLPKEYGREWYIERIKYYREQLEMMNG